MTNHDSKICVKPLGSAKLLSACFSTCRQTLRCWRALSGLVLAGKFYSFYDRRKTQVNLKLRGFCFIGKTSFQLSYGNITLLESDHDIVRYQVSDLIS